MKKSLAILLTVFFVISNITLSIPVAARNGVQDNFAVSYENTEEVFAPEYEPNFRLPQNMRGVMLHTDLFASSDAKGDDDAETPAPVDVEKVLDEIASLGMNAVIISVSDDESSYFSVDMNKTDNCDDEPLIFAMREAQSRGIAVYLILDLSAVGAEIEQGEINKYIAKIHKFALKYRCDGIILDGYYSAKNEESFARYMEFGAGIGYDTWLYDSTANAFKTAADTIRLTDNSIPVGIMLRDVWLNKLTDEDSPVTRGSNTSADFEAYRDGFADTCEFIIKGYADFAFVSAPDALTEAKVDVPYEAITDFWGQLCDYADTPMYIVHHNEKIGTDRAGWRDDSQILQQLTKAKSFPAYQGSVFNSYQGLVDNRLNSTTTLRMFFNDQINEDTLFEELVMHAPTSQSFSTNDAFAVFQGTYDDNFDVFLNGKEITLNAAGNFYVEKPLAVGMNYFTLNHKGKIVTYSIQRNVVTLHAIDNAIASGKSIEVEGGTNITVSAVAYRGANVTATINGTSFRLVQQDYNLDDPALNSSYAPFTGTFRAPDGIVGRAQSLGVITVTATLSGNTRSMQGATVTVVALPEPLYIPPVEVEMLDQESAGSGEVVGTIDPIRRSDEAVKLIRVERNNTPTFADNTTGSAFNPDISRLPAGTIDYFRTTVGGFHTTMHGKRISTENATVIDGFGIGENALNVVSSGVSGRRCFFRIALDSRTSFNVRTVGVEYSTAWGGNFNVSSFNPTFVYVDFDNVTSVTKLPEFDDNPMFSSGKWESVTVGGIPKFRLVLELRQRHGYGGVHARYNGDDELVLEFTHLTSSLSGMNIVIDPGHGRRENGALDPGAIGHIHEFDANIAVAHKLRDRLRALGANAHVLATDTTFYLTRNRNDYARNLFNCDMFISLHCNAVAGSGAKGTEAWYFTPFSQPLAAEISASVSAYFQNNVYADRVNRNRGAKNNLYQVTLAGDFPSVLVELGFVTNMEDAMALASDAHQTGIANAIASGIQAYLK